LSKFVFDWYPGISGQLEILSPPTKDDKFQVRYTPPFRATLRAPLEDADVGLGDMNPIHTGLEELVKRMKTAESRKSQVAPPPEPPSASGEVYQKLRELGDTLLSLMLPGKVQDELQQPGLFLEIGTDEELILLPWELLFDGQDFLCRKSRIGRFVQLSKTAVLPNMRPKQVFGEELDELRVLVVSVPKPQPMKDGKPLGNFEELSGVIKETEAISATLGKIDGVRHHVLEAATWQGFRSAVQVAPGQNPYHIVHFSGHAQSNPEGAEGSGIVLQDQLCTTGQLKRFFARNPPAFCFLNACETSQLTGSVVSWRKQHNLFGLASAILESGSYLLGSCWRIKDDTAATFAKSFYESFLARPGTTIGDAISQARQLAVDKEDPDNIGWAAYIYYGDPRLFLRKVG